MSQHVVKSIDLEVPFDRAFDLVADPRRLPDWTNAFASVNDGRAVMRTPEGEAEIALAVRAHHASGTVDWEMRFADGAIATAYSRLVPRSPVHTVFSFVLLPPQEPLEGLEGTLAAQAEILERELADLKELLEHARAS